MKHFLFFIFLLSASAQAQKLTGNGSPDADRILTETYLTLVAAANKDSMQTVFKRQMLQLLSQKKNLGLPMDSLAGLIKIRYSQEKK